MDPALYKDVKVTRGLTYHYFYSPASPGKPTLFFIHGFPSTSNDWARQVAYFKPKGYGILVPDCLGYGGTSKPTDFQDFRDKLHVADLIDVLDAENPSNVIGIGHDWGSSLLSALVHRHQDRFVGLVWVALSYMAPRVERFELKKAMAAMQQRVGSDIYGYWEFFNQEDAHVKSEQNIDSFLQLAFPVNPEIWRDWLCAAGKTQEWIEANRQTGRPSWQTEEEYATSRQKLLEGGLQSPLNYYKVQVASANLEDHQSIPKENWAVKKPALFVAATRDYVCRAEFGKAVMKHYAPHADIVELECGHWVQMEATEQLNDAIETWLVKLGDKDFPSTNAHL